MVRNGGVMAAFSDGALDESSLLPRPARTGVGADRRRFGVTGALLVATPVR